MRPEKEIIKEVLVDALKLINEKGWVQNRFSTEKGYCVLGAIHYAASIQSRDVRIEVTKVFAENIDSRMRTFDLVTWNDKWYRTKWEVTRIFKKAIASLV